jgi:hypothetical protein
MHYLKCENCGHLNPLQTEYLVFCANCQKKIANNFHDWQKNNSDKTFDDFKNLVALSEEQAAAPSEAKKPDGAKVWIYVAIAFSICFTVWLGYSATKAFKMLGAMRESTDMSMLTGDWDTREYCSGFSLSTPTPLTESAIELPEEVRGMIQEMHTYTLSGENDFTVAVNCFLYSPDVGELSLQGAADGAVEQIKAQPGVENFNYNEEAVDNGGIPGFVQRGTFEQLGKTIAFTNAGYSQGFRLWQILIINQQEDISGVISAERIYQSVSLNYTPEEATQ